MFQKIKPDVPISIDIKDNSNQEACRKVYELIRKYELFDTTVVGSEKSKVQKYMRTLDKRLAILFGEDEGFVMIFGYLTGLLPYISFYCEAALLPYMTKDFHKMKKEERRLARTWGKKLFYIVYIIMVQVVNMFFNPVIQNFNKRGIFTAYWVINQPGEATHIARTAPVMAILTDRTKTIKPYLLKHPKAE